MKIIIDLKKRPMQIEKITALKTLSSNLKYLTISKIIKMEMLGRLNRSW
tara:strand:+ start:160 stop:306 length:147 start_codon:yes stop_codon:yes gene_type:complete